MSAVDLAEALCRTHGHSEPPAALPDSPDPRHRVAACFECQRRADALAPFVAAREAQAAAKALRGFVDDLMADRGVTLADALIIRLINERADRIERGESS